ncbi:MAG: hypothetical protein FGM52_09185 [Mycobacterium sp.]|nr:hypothetical protein [Mycobacterium sp.]
MKKPNVIKCCRCRKRCRNSDRWNVEFVAGLEVGYLCPNCQTDEEHLGAEVNLAMGTTQRMTQTDGSDIGKIICELVNSYPTETVMRAKADRLELARSDPMARQMVMLMRRIADDMETGELYEDA